MTFTYIIGSALLIMGASLVGVIFINRYIGSRIHEYMPSLISFAAGVFLFTAGFLTIESIHLLGRWYLTALLVLGGYLLAFLAMKALPAFHHHHDESCPGHGNAGSRVLLGDGIHNIVDGLILVPAFIVSPWLGFGTAVSIFAHEFIQELSEFTVLRQSGYSVKKALLYNFLVSSTILIGVAFGFVLSNSVTVQGVLLALSAGFFLQIIFTDLLPGHGSLRGKQAFVQLGLIALGVSCIAIVNVLFAHSHDHSHNNGLDSTTLHDEHDEHDDI